jgi:hypothetical protein
LADLAISLMPKLHTFNEWFTARYQKNAAAQHTISHAVEIVTS